MARILNVGLGVVLLGLIALAADAAENEADPPAGKWQAIKGTRDGKPLAKEELASFKITLGDTGGRTGWSDPWMGTRDPFHNLAIRLDLTTSPKRLYAIRQAGLKATTYPGIFQLDEDRLNVCWSLEPWTSPDGPAMRSMPQEFAAPQGSGLTLLVFEKVKE